MLGLSDRDDILGIFVGRVVVLYMASSMKLSRLRMPTCTFPRKKCNDVKSELINERTIGGMFHTVTVITFRNLCIAGRPWILFTAVPYQAFSPSQLPQVCRSIHITQFERNPASPSPEDEDTTFQQRGASALMQGAKGHHWLLRGRYSP